MVCVSGAFWQSRSHMMYTTEVIQRKWTDSMGTCYSMVAHFPTILSILHLSAPPKLLSLHKYIWDMGLHSSIWFTVEKNGNGNQTYGTDLLQVCTRVQVRSRVRALASSIQHASASTSTIMHMIK